MLYQVAIFWQGLFNCWEFHDRRWGPASWSLYSILGLCMVILFSDHFILCVNNRAYCRQSHLWGRTAAFWSTAQTHSMRPTLSDKGSIKVARICQHLLSRPVTCYKSLSCFLRLIRHTYSLGDLTINSGICWGQGTTFTVSLISSDNTGSNFKPHYFYPVVLDLTVYWLSIYLLQLVGCNRLSVAIIIFCLGLSSKIF